MKNIGWIYSLVRVDKKNCVLFIGTQFFLEDSGKLIIVRIIILCISVNSNVHHLPKLLIYQRGIE
jgi:hypothetical protein